MIKIGIVGTGDRGTSFVKAAEHIPEMKIEAVVDTNPIRMEAVIKHHHYPPVKTFNNLDDLLDARIVDVIFITTPDWTHSDLIIKCLEKGYHVFCDKPLAINPEQIQKILVAANKSGKMQFMGFNMRYNPLFTKLKEVTLNKDIGDILTGWCYSGYQGDGYFRRWHKFREKSGGLIVHKGCHILDILNWMVDSYPVEVYAVGGQKVFGGNKKWPGCHECKETETCAYARKLTDDQMKLLEDIYIKAAAVDGYTRNYCVFGPSDVPDHYLLIINYANGARVIFEEIFFGTGLFYMGFAGEKGEIVTGSFIPDSIVVRRKFDQEKEKRYQVQKETKEFHGGADIYMLKDLVKSIDTGNQILPGFKEGARSAIIGVAAMISIEQRKVVKIDELLPLELLQ
ncbi:MAG TPA: Gfo/Idh/MocA family oxidoreductase [bacterium]|mgnify:FL=1|nr:Gfo/Idh/MocA family oxidoreductase [bacterium]HOL49991.1 Gfo/Idh/MocA family oxidoreductase [bacterium]HPO52720.1 Gfo/Idh/MocA family oxidoreductase [bacterium]